MNSILSNIPPVTKNLLLLNVAMYILSMYFLNVNGIDLAAMLGSHYILSPVFEPFQVVSHMFMHSSSSIFHVFMNMFLLVILGSHLERTWGAKHYFIFYFACGLGAFAMTTIVSTFEYNQLIDAMNYYGVDQNSLDNIIPYMDKWDNGAIGKLVEPVVTSTDQKNLAIYYSKFMMSAGIGASGAIFGLLAAFGILFPNTQFQLLFPPVPVKAKYLIGIYVIYEVYRGFNPVPGDDVAHWAHIGGALIGAIIVLIRRRTNKSNFY